MEREKNNFFADINLNENGIYSAKMAEGNFSCKNLLVIKSDLATLPPASLSLLGSCFYYVGETRKINDFEFRQNSFFQCQKKGEVFSWEEIGVKLSDLYNTEISSEKKGDILAFNGERWVNQQNVFKDGSVTKVDVGGLAKNTSISAKTPLEVLQLILMGSLDPGNISLNEIQTLYKKGTTVESLELIATLKSETEDLKKITWLQAEEEKGSEDLSGKSATASFTFTNLTEDVVLSAKLELANGESSTATRSIKFVNPSFYGISSDLSEILLEGKEVSLTFNFPSQMVLPVYKYPSSYGELSSITDAKGNDYTSMFGLSSETIDDIDYNVYTFLKEAKQPNFTYIFS